MLSPLNPNPPAPDQRRNLISRRALKLGDQKLFEKMVPGYTGRQSLSVEKRNRLSIISNPNITTRGDLKSKYIFVPFRGETLLSRPVSSQENKQRIGLDFFPS